MLAARYYGQLDVRVEQTIAPTIASPDDILVEVRYCGVCGTDLHEYLVGPIVTPTSPHPLTGAVLPQTLGHEFSAVVVGVGREVAEVKVGDRVAVMPSIVCGECYFCGRGMGHLCTRFASIGLSSDWGGLAELCVLKPYQVAKLPDEVSDLEGAVVEPACVAAYAVDRAGVNGGDVVLVTGAGPIGLLTAMYARAIGASRVIIAEPNPNRAALTRATDIGEVVDPTSEGYADSLLEATHGLGVDLSIEASGTSAGLADCIRLTRRRGSIVQAGLHTKPATIDGMALSEKDLSLFGSWCFYITDWPRIIRMIAAGQYPVSKIVTSTIPLADVVPRAFEALTDPASTELKVLIQPNA
jgi:(R,R)-butanediol dehydrogenase/meso-butanediol dehydrogenase/diacetyl reductase